MRDLNESFAKEFYSLYLNDEIDFKSSFEKNFGVNYKLLFGNMSIEAALFQTLSRYYRNEFFVKQNFIKKNPLSLQSLYGEEINVENSRCDLACFCNHSYVFEIKTKYDNLRRLKKQIESYSKVFEYVYIICSEDKIYDVFKDVPEWCGIFSYKDRSNCSFHLVRRASLSELRDITSMLNCMTLKERHRFIGEDDINTIVNEKDLKGISNSFNSALNCRISLKKSLQNTGQC